MSTKLQNPDLKKFHNVKVYRNLRNGLWSVMDTETRRVLGYAKEIMLMNATFPVSAKGVQRIREDRRKRVVAFVQGLFLGYYSDMECGAAVQFNPYKWDRFVDAHGHPVQGAEKVNLVSVAGMVWAKNLV
jgi:hypothetical protein